MIFTKSQWLPAERRAALVCAVLLLGLTACDRVSYVETLTIENPTDYDLLVNVRGNETSGVLGLGVVHKRATEEREQVIDVGPVWVYEFRYQGLDAGQVRVSRRDLANQDWRFVIPEEIGTRLQELGLNPSVD
jgi:hypothetical protein